MDPESLVASILSSLLSSDLVGSLFRTIFPVGSSQTIPIEQIDVQEGAFAATLCPGGCGARVVIRNLNVSSARTDRFPLTVQIVLDVSVTSIVAGRRAPLPIVTSAGDLTVDIDTARGATNLKFKSQIVFGAPRTPAGHFRVNPANIPEALRFSGVSVDIAEITPVPGFELEGADLQFRGTSIGGRAAAELIAVYEEDLVPYMRAMVRYLLNTLLCQRFGTQCPERPIPQLPPLGLARISPAIMAVGLVAASLVGLFFWKRSKRKQGLNSYDEESPLGDLKLYHRYLTASRAMKDERREFGVASASLNRLKHKQQKRAELEQDVSRDEEIQEAEIHRHRCFGLKQSAIAMRDAYQNVRRVTADPSWGQTVREIESCTGEHKSDCDEDQHYLFAAKDEIDHAHSVIKHARRVYEEQGCASVAGPSSSVPTSLLGLKARRP